MFSPLGVRLSLYPADSLPGPSVLEVPLASSPRPRANREQDRSGQMMGERCSGARTTIAGSSLNAAAFTCAISESLLLLLLTPHPPCASSAPVPRYVCIVTTRRRQQRPCGCRTHLQPQSEPELVAACAPRPDPGHRFGVGVRIRLREAWPRAPDLLSPHQLPFSISPAQGLSQYASACPQRRSVRSCHAADRYSQRSPPTRGCAS
ncbi:hypothetical protein BC628DRAFT_829689 [Trametes gibbosa]|nr:hypothetical protein BC628DRAFT_829689 [Trametes gibbosa]